MEKFGLLSLLNSALFSPSSAEKNSVAENGNDLLSALSSLLPADKTDAPEGEKRSDSSPAESEPPQKTEEKTNSPNAFLSLMEKHERTARKIEANERKNR